MKRIAAAFITMAMFSGSLALAQILLKPKALNVEQELIRLENEANEAWLKRDVEAYARLLADDYIETDPHGTMATKAEELELIKSTKTTVISALADDFRVRVYGDAAVVTFRLTVKNRIDDKETTGQERFTDTWIKRDGRWQCVAVHYSGITQKEGQGEFGGRLH